MRTSPLKRMTRLLPLTLGLVLAGCSGSDDDDERKPSADAGTDAGTGGNTDAGTGGNTDAGTGGNTDAGTGGNTDGGTQPSACLGDSFLKSLGKDRLLVGAKMTDTTAGSAPFDVRYIYLSSGMVDSTNVCTSCTSGCTAQGQTCANAGCFWWGCWQDTAVAPGNTVRLLISGSRSRGQIPFITYYVQLLGSGRQEGAEQLGVLNDVNFMRRYFNDWRFALQQVGNAQALLHLEPDLWGYLQFNSNNGEPRSTPAQVATANATDCAGQENNASGFARCMIAMARKYAPNAKVGLHASPWATRIDVYLNTNASFDVAGEARKVADFLLKLGAADTDFIAVEAADRDAGWYEVNRGEDTWWDATNATRPNFHQAFAWAKALSERLNKPNFWWQLPVGNMNMPNSDDRWRDNRVDYFFTHTAEVAAAHSVGFAFGSGTEDSTTKPEEDGGNLVNRVRAYKNAGGQRLCNP
ncbi:hypothetical protein HPC49_45670 [Pyxidicoccus fallax]|uniref:Lipoprotein n=1 Tax=Pyxidicoccus fallax TaxID=394095 RepID=A0A848LZF1_9BACT|nr:hypothetical protein [Pyxidicoccus fallax]NMO22980.1 hypothetical protein [Pyxidicoccus fallax]NPC85470.1 hypothetical protein [Pyxidicoccus fallax]